MSAHKKIDIVCIVIIILTLIITVLCMAVKPNNNGESVFSTDDYDSSYNAESSTKITLSDEKSSISGNGAYIKDNDVFIINPGSYIVSGKTENATITVNANSNDVIKLIFNGVDISSEESSVLKINQANKVLLTLADGSENTLKSGNVQSDEKIDGTVYSRDNLTINGSGKLSVTSANNGIVCNDTLKMTGGNIVINSENDAIHVHNETKIDGADISISAKDDAIHTEDDENKSLFLMESGNVDISSCYEGIEANEVTINGGTVKIVFDDDGINASGSGNDAVININGGDITILNENGTDSDGLDSNGSIYINGGNLFISLLGNGTNCAIDYGSENGGVCKINGGTVIACGGNQMAEKIDSSSEQGFIVYQTKQNANTDIKVTSQDGNTLISKTIPYSFSLLTVSSPEIKVGDVLSLSLGETSEQITVDNTKTAGNTNSFENSDKTDFSDNPPTNNENQPKMPDGNFNGEKPPEKPDGDFNGEEPPEKPDENREMSLDFENIDNNSGKPQNTDQQNKEKPEKPEEKRNTEETPTEENKAIDFSSYILLLVSVLVLIIGIVIAIVFKA